MIYRAASRYGNVVPYVRVLVLMLSEVKPVNTVALGSSKLPKIAVSPASTTSSFKLRPPYPAASAQLNHPEVLPARLGYTMSMSGTSTAASVFAIVAPRLNPLVNALIFVSKPVAQTFNLDVRARGRGCCHTIVFV